MVHFVASYYPINYYFIKGERVRKVKMKNREVLANQKKKEKQRERGGCWSLTKYWIRAEQTKGRYCIREDFAIFRCIFVLHFEESWFARDWFFFFFSLANLGIHYRFFCVWIWKFVIELNLGQTLFFCGFCSN